MPPIIVMTVNQMHTYIFYPNFGNLDFGETKFWLAMILVGQKLIANQSEPYSICVASLRSVFFLEKLFGSLFS